MKWIWACLAIALVLLVCMSLDSPDYGVGVEAGRARQGQLQNMFAAQRKQRESRLGKGDKLPAGKIPVQEEEHGEWLLEQVSLKPPFPFGKTFTLPGYDYSGASVVTDNYVRLTPDRQSKAGAVWSQQLLSAADWEVMFEFSISGKGVVAFGEGMAFWIIRDSVKETEKPCFGGPCKWEGLGIVVDTFDNNGDGLQPSLTAIWNDGSVVFDHDNDGAGAPGTLGHCKLNQPVRNRDKPLRLVVTYSSQPRLIEVRVHFADGTWQKCVENELANVGSNLYIGASAQTGQIADNHDLVSIRAFDLTQHNQQQQEKHGFAAASHHHFEADMDDDDLDDGEHSSLLWVLFWIFAALLLVGAVAGFVVLFKKHQEKRRRASSPFSGLGGRRGF